MYLNNINPDILNIGPFSIRFYGIVYALGFLWVSHILSKKAEQGKIKNLDKDKAVDLIIFGMIFALIGARIFHVISDFHLYRYNLIGIFKIWNGGLGFQGGLLGAVIAIYFYCKKHRINIIKILDTLAIPLPLILAFGRIANYVNSENYGPVTNMQWCVVFQRVDELCRHPTQFYQAGAQFVLFLTLLFMSKKKHKKGTLMSVFLIGYGLIRIVFDFLRVYNPSNYLFGISHTQYFGVLMVILGLYFLKFHKK